MTHNTDTFADGIVATMDRLERPAFGATLVAAIGTIAYMARNAAEAVIAGWNNQAPAVQAHIEGALPVVSHLAQTAFHLVSR